MKIVLDARKSIEGNAAAYFEKAKKSRKKLEGAKAALERTQLKIQQLVLQQEQAKAKFVGESEAKKAASARAVSRGWYEKFRWFVSSEGILCVGGRDADTNELIIKKHTDSSDLVFHTELAGSPFFVVKLNSKDGKAGEKTIEEAAIATASYSRAWKAGLQSVEVYHVKPEQVSKEARHGEYLSKGAFMIYGEKHYVPSKVGLAVGLTKEGKIMGGPLSAVAANCARLVMLLQGNDKPSDAGKKIIRRLGIDGTYLDEVIRALPAGEFRLVAAR